MTNNILYVSDGDYGTPAGYILPLVQGQYGQSIPVEVRDLAGNVVNLTGYSVLSATKRKGSQVTAWVGTIALSGTPSAAPNLNISVDEDDTGDYGGYSFYMELSNGSQVLKTHPVALTIVRDPAVNATAAAGLVGVTAAQKALLATISGLTGLVKMAAGSATGIAIQSFMETFLTSATALAARANLLPSYIGNGTKVLAVNSGGNDVEWVAQSGGGASLASEITDDSTYGNSVATVAESIEGLSNDITGVSNSKQDSSLLLTAIAGLSWVADSIIRITGASTAAVVTLASHVWTFLQSADAAAARSAIGAGTGNGDLLASNNLSELTATQSTARTNLGLGTLATQSGTFSGGGTLATGGFTLTVPATGTAALLAVANTFAAAQTVSLSSASPGMSVLNTGSGSGVRGNGAIGIEAYTSSGVSLHAVMQGATSTTTVNTIVRLTSRASGTPGAGFGTQIQWQLESSTTNDVDAGRLAILWNTATHASRIPDGVFYLTDSSAEREIWRGRATGSAAAIGFLGATPVARQAHIADPSGGAIQDAESRAAINSVLDVLEAFGLVATS